MNRLEQDAADTLRAYEERQARHKQGYGPIKSPPLSGKCWAPELTEHERAERQQQIAAGLLPF